MPKRKFFNVFPDFAKLASHCVANLSRLVEVFTNAIIVSTLRRQLNWTPIKAIIKMCKVDLLNKILCASAFSASLREKYTNNFIKEYSCYLWHNKGALNAINI